LIGVFKSDTDCAMDFQEINLFNDLPHKSEITEMANRLIGADWFKSFFIYEAGIIIAYTELGRANMAALASLLKQNSCGSLAHLDLSKIPLIDGLSSEPLRQDELQALTVFVHWSTLEQK
jgi:hypothetical protein